MSNDLYELIWKRAITSNDAQMERTTATIAISTVPQVLVATGEVIKFEGFLKGIHRDLPTMKIKMKKVKVYTLH